jgi:hypothetical protein
VVVTCPPSTRLIFVTQDKTALSSNCTTQQPQAACGAHPFLGDKTPTSSRKYVIKSNSGSPLYSITCPLSKNFIVNLPGLISESESCTDSIKTLPDEQFPFYFVKFQVCCTIQLYNILNIL